jgi:hypothetical protein
MPTQNFVAHDDMQGSPSPNPLVASSIPVDKEAILEMKRLARNPPSMVTQAELDENGDKVLVVYENTNMNPNMQHDHELWNRVREYDKANAELPFTPVLSRKHKQQVRKQIQIGKAPYKTRSQGGSSTCADQ